MEELIRKILALPPITLTEQEWEIAADIIKNLEPKTPRDFQKALNKREDARD